MAPVDAIYIAVVCPFLFGMTYIARVRPINVGNQNKMNPFINAYFDKYYQEHPLIFVDIGASGGIPKEWKRVDRHLQVIGFEPDEREFANLVESQELRYLNSALYKEKKKIEFHLCRKQEVSSIFLPSIDFLNQFPEEERFDVLETIILEADSLDNQFQKNGISDVDFIKLDTQGSELSILEGAIETLKTVFGLQIEVGFVELYQDQPLFSDVNSFISSHGFQLFDISPLYFWKRKDGVNLGSKKGQIIFADALYLKKSEKIRNNTIFGNKSKILKAISTCILYGYLDYAFEICKQSQKIGMITRREMNLISQSLKQYKSPSDRIPNFRGKGKIANMFYALYKIFESNHNGWVTVRK